MPSQNTFQKCQMCKGKIFVVFGWSLLVLVAHSFRRENKQGNTFLFPKISSMCSFQGQTHEVLSQSLLLLNGVLNAKNEALEHYSPSCHNELNVTTRCQVLLLLDSIWSFLAHCRASLFGEKSCGVAKFNAPQNDMCVLCF